MASNLNLATGGDTKTSLVLSLGCEIVNIQWQWSFVSDENRRVYFFCWENFPSSHPSPGRWRIVNHAIHAKGKRGNPSLGYEDTIRNLRMVREEGYEAFVVRQYGKDVDGRRRTVEIVPDPVPAVIVEERGTIWADATGEPATKEPQVIALSSPEPGRREVTLTVYESNARNRAECLRVHGSVCNVCEIPLEAIYGEEAAGCVHAHHCRPRSTLPDGYVPNITEDFATVCPNCHAMLHRNRPHDNPRTIAELRAMISRFSPVNDRT